MATNNSDSRQRVHDVEEYFSARLREGKNPVDICEERIAYWVNRRLTTGHLSGLKGIAERIKLWTAKLAIYKE